MTIISILDTVNNAFTITKSDSTIFPHLPSSSGVCVTKYIYVGGTGDVNVVTDGGKTVLFAGVQAGAVIPVAATQVLSTSTTATNMVGMW